MATYQGLCSFTKNTSPLITSEDPSNELYRAIINDVIDGIITINDHGIIISVNPATSKLFGYLPEEMIGQNVNILMPEPDEAKIIGKGREGKGKRKNGEFFPFLLSISEVFIGTEKIYAGIIQDITELKKTENALKESESKINAIFNGAVDGVITIDNRGIIEMVNPAAAKLFGYDQSEMLGQNIKMLMPDPDKRQHDGYIKNYQNTGERKIIGIGREVSAITKDGRLFPIYLSISEVKLENRTIYTGFIHDISQQKLREQLEEVVAKLEISNNNLKKAEKDIRKALNKEKELNELKSRFVTIASHEFRTPLSTILSSASLISRYREENEDEKRMKHVERIKSSVNNLKTILDDFLSISKIEEGKVYNLPSDFNLIEFSKEIIDDMQVMAKEGQEIVYTHQGNGTIVTLDKQLLKNILNNLLSNAIKYSSEAKKIVFSTVITEKLIKINVQDEGIGIPDADKEYLFDPFFRAQNAGNIQGTGLGLHIVKKYVDMMGGEMSYSSELDKGTLFTIVFPKF